MKKNVSVALIAAVVLLAVALVVMGTVGLNTKLTDGGCAVHISVGASYDADSVKALVASTGFNSPVVLESVKTSIELETGAMAQEELAAAAEKLLASVQADYPEASLVYAESFEAPQGVHHLRDIVFALLALAVIGYAYGALRFGWRKGFAPVLTALVVSVASGSVCALLSVVLEAGAAMTAAVAGSAVLAFVYSVVLCGKMHANAEYAVVKADLAVPVLVVVAAALLTVSCGVSFMASAVICAVFSAAGMYCLSPMFWKACTK